MKILVVGGGGREHALCWCLAASPLCNKLYCAPGNAGIAELAECLDIGAEDIEGLIAFARDAVIDFVVVGPEVPQYREYGRAAVRRNGRNIARPFGFPTGGRPAATRAWPMPHVARRAPRHRIAAPVEKQN